MDRRIFLPLALWLLGINSAAALAANPEYRCERGTVDNDAVAVTYSNVDVGTYSNPNDKVCTFAIDGAPSTGALSQQQPIAEVIDRIYQGDVDEIIIRLTLARSNVSTDAEKMRERLKPLLSESVSDLANCFHALQRFGQDGSPEPVMVFDNGTPAYLMIEDGPLAISCTVHDPGEYRDLRSEFPTLRLRAVSREDRTEDRLYVPIDAAR